jgi:hypothetical protein
MSMTSPPNAINIVKKKIAGTVIDPRVSERSRRFAAVAAEIHPPIVIFTPISFLWRRCRCAKSCAASGGTATATATATGTHPLQRADVHRRFDRVGAIPLLLNRRALPVRH